MTSTGSGSPSRARGSRSSVLSLCIGNDHSRRDRAGTATGEVTVVAAGSPQRLSAARPMPPPGAASTILRMTARRYAAVWQDGGDQMAGRILLAPGALIFEGAGAGREACCRIPYHRIASLRLGRSPIDRVGGRPALVLKLGDGATIRVASPELGALHELEEALRDEKLREES